MNIAKKTIALLFLCMLLFPAAAQDAVQRAIASANTHMLVREYDKAFSYANFVIRFYTGKEMPVDAVDMCERVVAAWSTDLKSKEKIDELIALEQSLTAAPASVRAKAAEPIAYAKQIQQQRAEAARKAAEEQRLVEAEQKRVAQIEEAIRLERLKEQEREAQRQQERLEFERRESELQAQRSREAAQQQAMLDAMIQENRLAEERKEAARMQERLASQDLQVELEKQRLDAEASFRSELTKILEINNRSGAEAFQTVSRTSTAVIVGLAILGFIVLAGISLIVFMSMRQQAIQQEQFQSTIKVMTSMRNAGPDLSAMALPFISQAMQALPNNTVPLLENKSGPGASTSTTPGAMNTPEELKALYEKCQGYADQIDQVTNRKNASKRVAELVYKISKEMGYSEHDALMYYTVGLVYDIGFLNIDPVLLRSEHINEEQFAQIKTHTTIGVNMVFFIDEKNRDIFKDGVSKHHENLDGTGYPFGLKGTEIPYIARVLRVAETYIALVSSRDYKSITDRDTAIKELLENNNQYDLDIVKVLEGIV